MATENDLDEVIERYHLTESELLKGNPEPAKKLWSRREDVTLANPYGPPASGWEQVDQATESASSVIRGGESVEFETVAEYVTPELAYIVWIERTEARVGEGEDLSPIALRVTTILRPEDGAWKIVHRHADPITTAQPAESVIQQ